jgi:flagellar protein FlbD
MIALTRLNGSRFAVNSDLIERVDASPDTVITLVDGAKYLVKESIDEVIEAVRSFRASVVATSVAGPTTSSSAPLRIVSSTEDG